MYVVCGAVCVCVSTFSSSYFLLFLFHRRLKFVLFFSTCSKNIPYNQNNRRLREWFHFSAHFDCNMWRVIRFLFRCFLVFKEMQYIVCQHVAQKWIRKKKIYNKRRAHCRSMCATHHLKNKWQAIDLISCDKFPQATHKNRIN